ncbi:TonB-dependent siderophore receptor [Phyllobacterium sp. SB3]|uniref:TonB-dependent siderophore receptor n=1 Tax=Phyllobacterium sp. SB3 TaxID=3156073 RepID=UPI0032AFE48E
MIENTGHVISQRVRRQWPAALMMRIAFCLTALLTALPMIEAVAQTAGARTFNIPSQPLNRALRVLADQSGIQLAYRTSVASGATSPAVSGTMSTEQALSRLLSGSNLQYSFTGANTVTILADIPAGAGVNVDGSIQLDPIVIEGQRESAWGPVDGYVAARAAAGTKTDAPIIETPQSVSVVTKDLLTDQKATSLADALVYTPGVSVQSQTFSRMVDDVMLRGFNLASGSSGMLRDGLKLQSNVYDGGQEPYGLERVEVLRGASSVLYGQLSPGGIINGVSKRPTLEPLHEVNVEYGSYEKKQMSFDFSDALDAGETLRYRLTGVLRDAENWVDDVPDDKIYLAPALTWQPDAATSLTLLSSYQHVNTRFATPLDYTDVSSGRIPRDLFIGEPDFDLYKGDIYTLGYVFEHEFDSGLKLRQNARYFHSDVDWNYMMGNLSPVIDGDLYRLASYRTEKSYGATVDTSLERTFDWGATEHTALLGVDYYRRGYDSHRYRGTGFVPLNVDAPVYSGYPDIDFGTDRGSDNVSDQVGIYIQDQIKYENWILLIGGRHDWSDSSTTSYQNGIESRQKDAAFTGRAGLVYQFDNGIAPYVSVSQSFSPQIGMDTLTGASLEPNEGLQYEAGVRYQPPGTNILLSAAVYELTQKNVVSFDLFGDAYQVGKVRSRGIELEARAEYGNLGLVSAYAYTDANILESALEYEVGQQVDMVPRHTFSVWADYKLGSLGLKGMKVGGGLRYIGKTNVTDSIDVLGEPVSVPGYLLADAMVSYDFGALDQKYDGLSLTVNARNLFDKKFYTCAGATGCRYGEPLTVTGTLSYKW